MSTKRHFSAALLIFFLTSQAFAITYSVDRTVGNGAIDGLIVTDGTIGTLGVGNILDWDLILTIGSTDFELMAGDDSDVLVLGSPLSATANELLFDPTGGAGQGYLVFRSLDSASAVVDAQWCVLSPDVSCQAGSGDESIEFFNPDPFQLLEIESMSPVGIQTLATVVPLPAAAWLFGSALLGLATVKRRKA